MIDRFIVAKQLIDQAKNIVLSTHDDPDADGLGSMLALQAALQKIGKPAIVFTQQPLAESLKFLPGQAAIKNEVAVDRTDLIIGLDYGSWERLEIFKVYPQLKTNFLTFDHHTIGDHLEFKIVSDDFSSTSEIIHSFIAWLGLPIDSQIATCLLTGILDDTGGFRHPNSSAQTLRVVGELILQGAPLQKISQQSSGFNLDAKFSALTEVFKRIQIDEEINLVFSVIDHALFSQSVVGFNETNISFILSTAPEAKIAALLTEKIPGYFDISLRAQQDRGVNVAKIAQRFGGGGHQLAAGFRSSDSAEEIVNKIKSFILTDIERL